MQNMQVEKVVRLIEELKGKVSHEIYSLDRELYGEPFSSFLESMGFNHYGNFETDPIGDGFKKEVEKRLDENGDYEDEVFAIKPFCWCGVCDGGSNGFCSRLDKPNFHYKPTDFQLFWYKYPLRGNYCNRNITAEEFLRMINHCKESFYK